MLAVGKPQGSPFVMLKRPDVLEFFAGEFDAGRSVSYLDLVGVFGLSPEAACGHLSGLWRDRLAKIQDRIGEALG